MMSEAHQCLRNKIENKIINPLYCTKFFVLSKNHACRECKTKRTKERVMFIGHDFIKTGQKQILYIALFIAVT
jgi:hypothetical protein